MNVQVNEDENNTRVVKRLKNNKSDSNDDDKPLTLNLNKSTKKLNQDSVQIFPRTLNRNESHLNKISFYKKITSRITTFFRELILFFKL